MKKTLIFVMLLSILLPVFPAISEEARILTIIGAADIPGGDGGGLKRQRRYLRRKIRDTLWYLKKRPSRMR